MRKLLKGENLMFCTNRKKMQCHKSIVLGCSVGLLLTACGSSALAGDNTTAYSPFAEGSTTTHRSVTDLNFGALNIYVGASLPVGTDLLALRFLFDTTQGGNTSGYLTPLLFEYKSVEAATVYTVVGIGKGFPVNLSSAPQEIPFELVAGSKVASGANFNFGFVMGIVNSSGVQVENGQGVVDFDGEYPDGGQGVGGVGTTNDWLYAQLASPNVALGTTFGLANADYTMGLPYRTYSAQAIGVLPAQ
jgi:hypothetical protein